jgi:hypothetical protein
MTTRSGFHAICAVAVSMLFVSLAPAQNLLVTGVTYKIDNAGKYHPLGNVSIQAYRNMAPILKKPASSDVKDGTFKLDVPAGDPFEVWFHGADKVPTLKLLAGVPNVKNEVHVVLLTKDQYAKTAIGKEFPLEKKMECLMMQLPKDDDFARKLRLDWRER